jgi:single-strand DNA-binding protein
MNTVVLIGRLTRDPDLRYTPTGTAVAKMTLAVDRDMAKDKKAEAAQKGQPTADFIPVTVFGKQAENCANYLLKGRMCAVEGRIQTGSNTAQDGGKRYTLDVVARRIEFIGGKKEGGAIAASAPADSNPQAGTPVQTDIPDDGDYFEHLGDDGFDIDDEDIPF